MVGSGTVTLAEPGLMQLAMRTRIGQLEVKVAVFKWRAASLGGGRVRTAASPCSVSLPPKAYELLAMWSLLTLARSFSRRAS